MEINIPSQQIRAKRKGGLINEGGIISTEYGILYVRTTVHEQSSHLENVRFHDNLCHSYVLIYSLLNAGLCGHGITLNKAHTKYTSLLVAHFLPVEI